VTSESAVRDLVNKTASEEGRLDYCFNNADIAIVGEVLDMETDHWRRILEVNLFGVKVSVVRPGLVKTNILDTATSVGFDKDRLLDLTPGNPMDADPAARTILEGVARNRAIITFPFRVRLFRWLYRLFPDLPEPLGRAGMRKLRAALPPLLGRILRGSAGSLTRQRDT
jgi:NAD(P)-dependent dehydrogenase (short-subunit alcohol dehydrogenase family)